MTIKNGLSYKTINEIEEQTREILAKHMSTAGDKKEIIKLSQDIARARTSLEDFLKEINDLSVEDEKKFDAILEKLEKFSVFPDNSKDFKAILQVLADHSELLGKLEKKRVVKNTNTITEVEIVEVPTPVHGLPNKYVIYFILFMVSYMELLHWVIYRG